MSGSPVWLLAVLPELSTVSDIFGGNAFLPVLFVPATLLSGHAVLPAAQRTDIYLTALGIVLTLIYAAVCCFGRAAASLGWGSTRWPSSSCTALAWSDYSPSRTCGDRDKTISLRAVVELARPVITAAADRLTGLKASWL